MKRSLLLVLFLLASCSGSLIHPSILEGSTCELPCWNDIIVGKTTRQEELDILAALSFVDPETVSQASLDYSYLFYTDVDIFVLYPGLEGEIPSETAHKVDLWTYTLNDVVVEMAFVGWLGMTFGQIVEQIGEPEFIVVTRSEHMNCYIVHAINPSIGVSFLYYTDKVPRTMRSEISPDIEIRILDIFDPIIYPQMLEAGLFCIEERCNGEQTMKIMHPWTGYGSIEEKYPYREP